MCLNKIYYFMVIMETELTFYYTSTLQNPMHLAILFFTIQVVLASLYSVWNCFLILLIFNLIPEALIK